MFFDKWEFYEDSKSKWRWRRIDSYDLIVASSIEGYIEKDDCINDAIGNGMPTGTA